MVGSFAFSVLLASAQGQKLEKVFPGVYRLHFGSPERNTPLKFRSAPAATVSLAKLGDRQLPLLPILGKRTDHGYALEIPLAKDEKLYGLGLNTHAFDLNGRRSWVVPSDNPEADTNESHAPEPFYVSTAGYGVYVDTARFANFSVGSIDRVSTSTTRQEGRESVLVDIPSSAGADIYLFAGPTSREAVQRYILFSGGGAVPPLWGLGIAYRAKGDFSAVQALSLAKSFRKDDIPCDIFGVEPGWQTQTYSCSFLWNKGRFPDPDGFIKEMHNDGFRLSFWEHPFTHPSSPIYNDLKPFAGNYRVWNGLVPDFATPQARKIYLGIQNESLYSKGVDSVKIDEVDHQPFKPNPWSYPEATSFPSGLDGETMHSLIGNLAAQTMLEPLRAKNLRTWGLIRQEGAISASLPYTVYSDSYDFKSYIRGMVKQGFGGHMWVPEVRDAKTVDELIRRTQAVIFSPYAMVNCWYMGIPPWRQIDARLANNGIEMPEATETTRRIRELFRLRMSLIPYLYSAFNDYHETGMPPTRALVLDYPADSLVREIDDEFMVGKSLLVAPVVTGNKRSVYLPKGTWFDFFTGEKIEGGQRFEVEKDLDSMPIFVKDGSILPLAEPVNHIARDTAFTLHVRLFGSNPQPFVLYEDDGESYDYEKGAQNQITLSADRSIKRQGTWKGSRYQIASWDSF